MLSRMQNDQLKQKMLENRDQIFDGICPPEPNKFLEDTRAAKIAAKQYTEIRSERNTRRRRVILIAASIVAVIGVTFGASPDARAFASRIGLQIVGIFTSQTKTVEYGLVDPDLVLVNRTTHENVRFISSDYIFMGSISVALTQSDSVEEGPVVSTEKGFVGIIEIRGNAMDYYQDPDGYFGKVVIDGILVNLAVATDSESVFCTIAQTLQIIS